MFFAEGTLWFSTAASESVTNRYGECFDGALTARNCLRELCCELVSAIVYAIVVVYCCVCCSRTVLYICLSDQNRCWIFAPKYPATYIKVSGKIYSNDV